MKIYQPSTSVIIPTLNRPGALRELLISLLKQSTLPNEIIIVDQSKNLDSKQMTKLLLIKYNNIDLKYISDSTITGIAQARNRGINLVSNDIILFLDDDAILENDFLENIMQIYLKYPTVSGVGGVITNYKGSFKYDLFKKIFFKGFFYDEREHIYCNLDSYRNLDFISTKKLGGGLMSFKKEVFNNFLFDERYIYYSFGEDLDFSYRVSKKYEIGISPKARISHVSLSQRNEKKLKEREFCSWNFLFKINLEKNFYNYLCYTWLLLGIFIQATWRYLFKRKKDALRGLISGYKISSNDFKGCDFITLKNASSNNL